LTFVAMLDFADRALTSAVAEPIRTEFHLTDTELGFLMGFAFALLRVVIGIPMGRLADVWNRRNLLAAALTLWSAATVAMGFARDFLQLVITRFLVGAGTAGSWPPALSMVADLFPIDQRGTAMGIWNVGTVIGFSVGLGGGAVLADVYGWRIALITFGGLGVAVAIMLMIAIREPARRNADGASVEQDTAPTVASVFRLILRQKSLCHAIAAFSLLVLVDTSIGLWAASFFVRSHGLSVAEAGSLVAVVFVAGGIPGTFLGGHLMDRLARRDRRWHVWSSLTVALLSAPLAVGFLLAPSTYAALAVMVVHTFVWSMWYAPQTTLGTGLVTSRARAMTWAIFSIFLLVLGGGLGPQIIGVLSDAFHPTQGEHSLRYALVVVLTAQLWAAVHLFLASRTLVADYDRVAED
jgi:MFS family permease